MLVRVRTWTHIRPPRARDPPPRSRLGPNSARGAGAQRRSGRRPLPNCQGQGRERAAARPGAVAALVPWGESAASPTGPRWRRGTGIFLLAAATPRPKAPTPRPRDTGFSPEAAGRSPSAGRRQTHLGWEARRAESLAADTEPPQSAPVLNNGP